MERRLLLVLCLLGALLLAGLPPAEHVRAGTITVDTLLDTTGAGCPAGACSLRRAIGVAGDGDTITFSVTGTIALTNGVLFVDKSVTINGPGANSLTVDGNNSTQVFSIGSFSTGRQVAISGITIQGGRSFNPGAGLFVATTVTLTNVTVSGNSAEYGGGIANGAGGNLTLNSVRVSNNSVPAGNAVGASGGGLFSSSTLTVNDSLISGNMALGGSTTGGGVFINGPTIIRRTAILNNSADQGGGIYVNVFDTARTVTIENSTIAQNTARLGAAISTVDGTIVINASTVARNTVLGSGGAVFFPTSSGSVKLTSRGSVYGPHNALNFSPANLGPTHLASGDFNLSSDDSAVASFANPGDVNNTDPLLALVLAACGGVGQAWFPQPGSPAIGTGSSGLATDQCGNTRSLPDTKGAVFLTASVPTGTPTPTATATPTATPTRIPGEFNGDGFVDIRDYGVWRQNFGQTNCGNPADADGNCLVDIRDYAIWRLHFGEGTPPDRRPVAALPAGVSPAPRGTPGPALLEGDQASVGNWALWQADGSGPAVPVIPLVGGLLGLGGLARWRKRQPPWEG